MGKMTETQSQDLDALRTELVDAAGAAPDLQALEGCGSRRWARRAG